jgi:hypothetical protein
LNRWKDSVGSYLGNNKTAIYKRLAHNLPVCLRGKIWLKIGICQINGIFYSKDVASVQKTRHCQGVGGVDNPLYSVLVPNSDGHTFVYSLPLPLHR